MGFAWTIVALIVVMTLAWRFLGAYLAAVFGGRVTWLRFAERPVYRMLGVDPDAEQHGSATASRSSSSPPSPSA
jgi:potassium-transporting ATPase potassium-binding subunit